MGDRCAGLLLALVMFILIGTPSAGASDVCGTPESPPSCLAPCADNPQMLSARHSFTAAADTGDPATLFAMGQSRLGLAGAGDAPVCRPTQEDHRAAAGWFRRAASLGLVQAQLALGDFYELGQGGEKDYAEAFRWFHAAAAQGDARGLFRVGVFHDFGRASVAPDATIAAQWYAQAAKRGSCDARFALATMYAQGRGVTRNPVTAWALYHLVVERPYPAPCYGKESGDARRIGKSLAAQFTPVEMAVARKGLAEWESP